MATDEIVRGRQCRNASFARHSENRSESVASFQGLPPASLPRLRSLVTRAASQHGRPGARRSPVTGSASIVSGAPSERSRLPPGPHRHRAMRGPALGVARLRLAMPWRAGPVDAGDSGSQKDRRRTTASRRLLHCNNSLVGRAQRAGSSGSSSRRSLRHTRTIRTCFGSRR